MTLPLRLAGWAQHAPALHWRADETLFSWCSRYHDLSLNLHDWVTGWQLFGDWRKGRAHDLPSRIDTWVDRTEGQLGDARSLILEHTLLPYFLPWRPVAQGEAAIAAMRGDGIGSLKFTLGLLTGRCGADHPLKACPECIAQDLQHFGRAHWRLPHQWPGAWCCLEHRVGLRPHTAGGPDRPQRCWCLPQPVRRGPGLGRGSGLVLSRDPRAEPERLARLAHFTREATRLPAGALSDPQRLAAVYRQQMVRLGWLSRPDRLPWADLLQELQARWHVWTILPELQTWNGDASWRAQAARLLYARGGYTHPLRHLLMIEALFPDWGSFLLGMETAPALDVDFGQHGRPPPASTTVSSATEPISIDSTPDRHPTSARALARALHISVHTAQARLAAQGQTWIPRPKSLYGPEREQVRSLLRTGRPVAEVGQALKISLSAVYRILQTDPALGAAWRQARLLAERDRRRARWRSLFERWPGLSPVLAHRLEPACHQWLYRHDRDWLQDVSHELTTAAPRGNRVEGRWRVVDQHLARQVEVAALELAEHEGLSLPALLERLPALHRRLGRLNVLPRTTAALERLFR